MRQLEVTVHAIALVVVASLLAGCGSGDSGSSANVVTPSPPAEDATPCVPGGDVIGAWKVTANNETLIPASPELKFFSYNQPSVNSSGLVVFRGRAKSAAGSGDTGTMVRGLFAVDACRPSPTLRTLADTSTVVPAPNNTGATFKEFPSIPRIDMDSAVIASRGQSSPVWSSVDGRIGTSGVYVASAAGLSTGIGLLGALPEFSYMQVPNASATGLKFDQFPGSPTVTDGRYLAFKGNFTDGTTPRTGVYYRDLSVSNSPVHVIADSSMLIPGAATAFGSTAPPSAAKGKVAFVGLDNEEAPTAGGLYLAPVADKPVLTPLVQIAQTVVTNSSGNALAGDPTFNQLGEGLSFDGRYVSFWGAWSTETREITLSCPTDGNAALIAACQQQYPSGETTVLVPVNQGIFLYDTVQSALRMVARAGTGEQFQDFLYWVFSGAAGGSGESGATDAEPPRWRASAFAAVDGARGVIFKGTLTPAESGTTPGSGIYGAAFAGNAMGAVFKVAEVGDSIASMDPAAPADSTIGSLGIERESLRGGWLTLTIASAETETEGEEAEVVGWAGIYTTYFPGAFHVSAAVAPETVGRLVLGN